MSYPRFFKIALSATVIAVSFLMVTSLSAQVSETRQEKYFEDEGSQSSQKTLDEESGLKEQIEQQVRSPLELPKRWRISGSFGYEYDDNVPLASKFKEFRPGSPNTSANRFMLNTGMSYDAYRDHHHRVRLSYKFNQNFHDDGLKDYNFQNHDLGIEGRRVFMAFERPSQLALRYHFAYAFLDNDTFSSSHYWSALWITEWAQNWILTAYERLGVITFRDKGFDEDISSRDGFYHQTGFVQTYLFNGRKSSFSAGYEFAFADTDGDNFDVLEHGARAIFKTPVIEKIQFEASFFFQLSDYHNFAASPQRKDARIYYEFRLSRPIGTHWSLSGFYKRTDVKNFNQGALGQFSYNRNVGGAKLSFIY